MESKVDDILMWLIIGSTALVGFTIAGVTGFGGGILILPVLVLFLGPREAIPMVSIAQGIASLVRFWMHRQHIAWSVMGWFAMGTIPVAILATMLFVHTPDTIYIRALGGALLLLAIYRHSAWGQRLTMRPLGFVPVGAATGLVAGYLGVGGPVPAPFLLAYGLVGHAYVGTMGASTLIPQFFKLLVLGSSDLLGSRTLVIGLGLGVFSWLGAHLGQFIIRWLPERWFSHLVEGMLVVVGIFLLLRG